jgi:hypothetical protein
LSVLRKYLFLLSALFNFCGIVLSDDIAPQRITFIEPEFMLGENIQIYDSFPHTDPRTSFFINIGILNMDTAKLILWI